MRGAIPICAILALAACHDRPSEVVDNNADMHLADNGTVVVDAAVDPRVHAADEVEFARAAALEDSFAIEAGTLALAKATSPAIRAFAQQMVDAHRSARARLKLALETSVPGATLPLALDPSDRELLSILARSERGAEFETSYLDAQTDALKAGLALMTRESTGDQGSALRSHARAMAPALSEQLKLARVLDKSGADAGARARR